MGIYVKRFRLTLVIGLALVIGLVATALAGTFEPVTVTDQTLTAPVANPVPGSYQPRYISGFGSGDSFTVFFEDRDAAYTISYASTTTGPTGFPAGATATNITDTHFVVKDWPINVGGTDYAYRAWGSVGNNMSHNFYVSNNLTNWVLVSTFTIPNVSPWTSPRPLMPGYVYYGFHDVILLNGTYYAFAESNRGQTLLVRSANGDDVWEAFDSIGGSNAAWGPLQLPESGTPSGSFIDLGHDRGYGKVHVRGNDSGFYLAVNTAAVASLAPAALEEAFINPDNWTWHDGTTGLPASPILSETSEHDLRECWVVPNSDPDADWLIIYDADFGATDGGKALGYATLSPPLPPPEIVWVDDDYCDGCVNDGHTWGYDAFATIQEGIDAVSGSTVYVAAGTYNEHVTVDKSLTLQGAGASQTTIDVSGLSIQNPHIAVEVQNGVKNVVVDGFTIIGVSALHHSDDVVIRCGGSGGTNTDITISNNIIDGYVGILFKNGDSLTIQQNDITFNKNAVVIQGGCTNVYISDNSMTGGSSVDADPAGIYMTSTTGSITGNTIQNVIGPDNKGKGITGSSNHDLLIDNNVINNTGYDGISFWSNTHHVIISNNTLSNNAQTYAKGGAITIKGDDITIINNNITGSGHDGVIIDTHVLASVRIDINYNNIWGNADYGVNVKDAGETVNAEHNWWGDASGPYDPAGTTEVPLCTGCPTTESNTDGLGDPVSDNVDYCPWLLVPYPLTPMASFVVDHAKLDFKTKPNDDKVHVRGSLEVDLVGGDDVDISEDVIVTVGPLSQTITMVEKGKKGDKWEYKRPKHGDGFIKHMTIDWKKGQFDIHMDKADLTGVINPVTISILIGDDVGSTSILMNEKKHHWDYRAEHGPKAVEIEPVAITDELRVVAYPNPIRDVHTATFKVMGPLAAEVEEIRVQIYDLSGHLVWEDAALGSELDWHTNSLSGDYLANGFYLYRVQVRIGANWIIQDTGKIAVLR